MEQWSWMCTAVSFIFILPEHFLALKGVEA